MRFLSLIAAVAVVVIPEAALAREDGQIWLSGGGTVKLDDNWKLSEDIIARVSDNRDGLYEVEASTLLNLKAAKDVTLAAGYVHNPQYSDGDFSVLERRAREQVTIDNLAKVGTGKLSVRLRMEQRWRENADGTGWRMRPYLKYSLPLRGKTSLTLSSEVFLNLNTTAFQRQDGLDRMRNLIAINTPLLKNVTVEAGYLNQHGFVRDGDDATDHVASLSISASI